jgi:hypothetical protein
MPGYDFIGQPVQGKEVLFQGVTFAQYRFQEL